MKKIILNIAYLSMISLTLVSCKKDKPNDDDNHHEDEVSAVINMSSFNDGDTIASGATFHMSGTITGTAEMHGYEIILHNHTTMQDVFTVNNHDHAATYNVHEHWDNNVADTSTIMFTLNTILDHAGNKATKVIHVVCLP